MNTLPRTQSLTSTQKQIAYILYKFRFGTARTLAEHEQVTLRVMNRRLQVMMRSGYIGRDFEPSYRLRHRPATYYLKPAGIAILQSHTGGFKPAVIKRMRLDGYASAKAIQHALRVFEVYLYLRSAYASDSAIVFRFYTKSYTFGDARFPQPLPDAYSTVRLTPDQPRQHLLVECFDSTRSLVYMRRRINQLVDHADSRAWTLTADYPTVLIICTSPRLQRIVNRWAQAAVARSWANGLHVLVKTSSELPKMSLADRSVI